jgi:hypothetical protein
MATRLTFLFIVGNNSFVDSSAKLSAVALRKEVLMPNDSRGPDRVPVRVVHSGRADSQLPKMPSRTLRLRLYNAPLKIETCQLESTRYSIQ